VVKVVKDPRTHWRTIGQKIIKSFYELTTTTTTRANNVTT